jgi:hypothetical protein
VEREDEFESEMSDDGNMMDIDDDVVAIEPLTSKQMILNGLLEIPDFSVV